LASEVNFTIFLTLQLQSVVFNKVPFKYESACLVLDRVNLFEFYFAQVVALKRLLLFVRTSIAVDVALHLCEHVKYICSICERQVNQFQRY